MRRFLVGAAVVCGATVAMASPAHAARPCIAQLASSAHGEMSAVVGDWQSDFLGLDQPPGMYAAHIAHMSTDCPGPQG